MRKLFLTCLYLFFIIPVFAQVNYSKAKVYTSEGDVFDCFIKSTSIETTPQQFTYVLAKGEAEKNIDVSGVRKIIFEDGTIYEKHTINVPVIYEPYINRKASQYDIRSNRFLGEAIVEKILSGEISLFLFKDKFNYPHFFYEIENGNNFTELPYRTYVDDNNQFKEDLSFKNELNFLIQKYNCTTVSNNQLEQLHYSTSSMIAVF